MSGNGECPACFWSRYRFAHPGAVLVSLRPDDSVYEVVHEDCPGDWAEGNRDACTRTGTLVFGNPRICTCP